MGLIVVGVLNLSPLIFGRSLVPEHFSFAMQDLAQQLANRIEPIKPIRPAIRLINMPLMSPPNQGYVSRAEVAYLLPILDRAGADVILLDIDLSRTSPADAQLVAAMASLQHAQVVIGLSLSRRQSGQCAGRTDSNVPQPSGADQIRWPLALINKPWPHVWYGSLETEADSDGVYRSVCPFVTARTLGPPVFGATLNERRTTSRTILLPSAALLSASLAKGRQTGFNANSMDINGPWLWRPGIRAFDNPSITNAAFEPRRIRYLGDGKPEEIGGFPISSVTPLPIEFVTDSSDLSELRGAIIIIGSNSTLAEDQSATPLGWMSGMTVTANIVAGDVTNQFLAKATGQLDHLLLEGLFVIVGALVFVLGNDELPRRLRKYVGQSFWFRAAATIARTLWLGVMAGIVTALMVVVQTKIAADGVMAGLAVDPAIGIVAVLAERLIHFAGVVEAHLSHMVTQLGTKLERHQADRSSTGFEQQVDRESSA